MQINLPMNQDWDWSRHITCNHFSFQCLAIIYFFSWCITKDVGTVCRAFFNSLYRCLARGARAVLQLYAEDLNQRTMIMTSAMKAGFAGGVVVDWPHRWLLFITKNCFLTVDKRTVNFCCIRYFSFFFVRGKRYCNVFTRWLNMRIIMKSRVLV